VGLPVERTVLLVVDVVDALAEGQRVAGIGHRVVAEALLAVQQAAVVHAQQLTNGGGVRCLHLQAEEERGRHRQSRMPRIARGGLVDVDRIGLARGLGEEAQAAFFHFHLEGRQLVADVAAVDHRLP
jgi:hypothetical protein